MAHSRTLIQAVVCLAIIGGLATGLVGADEEFLPERWLSRRNLGKLATVTPQSNRPVERVQSQTLDEWKTERRMYEQALIELIGKWPERRPLLEAKVLDPVATDKWTRFKVSFSSLPSAVESASQIRAWLFVPNGGKKKMPAIVTLHQTLPQGKDEPAGIKASLPWLTFATYYAERGYVTLAPDMIGYGERTTGGYAQTGFEWSDARPILYAQPDLTVLGLMLFDVSRCVDFLQERPEVDSKRIGVMGHSLGGILVNGVLPLEPRLKVGVASCGYALFRTDELFPERWAAANSAYLPRLALYRGRAHELPLDFHQILALSAPRAHLIQTAMGDTIWTLPGVARTPFVVDEVRRIRRLYSDEAVENFIAIAPAAGAEDRNHGWYPETQKAADALFAKILNAND